MQANIPSEEEVLGYFKSLSNWGRWGAEDQLGTPNLITPEKTKRAIETVKEGVQVSLSRTVSFEASADAPNPPVHFMVESGEGWASGDKVSPRAYPAAADYFGMIFHGVTVTHVDSLAHFFWEGKTYNGFPAHLVSTSLGATFGSVEEAKNGIVSRGVLVDVPMVRNIDWVERGEGVMPEDILAAEERCGFKVEEGDILLNTHRPTAPPERGRPRGPVPRQYRLPGRLSAPLSPARHRRIGFRHRERRQPSPVFPRGQPDTPSGNYGHGDLDSGQRQSGGTIGSLPGTGPLGVHGVYRPAAPAQHHRLPGEPHRHILKVWSQSNAGLRPIRFNRTISQHIH